MFVVSQTLIALEYSYLVIELSEATPCFGATVLFEGLPIAKAANRGNGGMTDIRMLPGSEAQMEDAELFARSLPPYVIEAPDHCAVPASWKLPMSLQLLVDLLACSELLNRIYRHMFDRIFGKELCFICDTELIHVEHVKLGNLTPTEIAALHAGVRARYGSHVKILSELAPEEAFAVWKASVSLSAKEQILRDSVDRTHGSDQIGTADRGPQVRINN
jgi:hypothetical protein